MRRKDCILLIVNLRKMSKDRQASRKYDSLELTQAYLSLKIQKNEQKAYRRFRNFKMMNLKQNNDWDAPLMFENAMKKAEENKKAAKQNKKKAKSKDVKEEVEPTPKEVEPVKMKTHEEIYRELKKKRKIKNIELQEDIDAKFAELPKRLRTRITNKQMKYIMNNTTMGDIISHLMNQNKVGIVRAPKAKEHHYKPGKNMAEQVNRVLNQTVNQKAGMTEMERRQKKNEMLNYFVDKRKKKKPSALIRAKNLALEKKKKLNEELKNTDHHELEEKKEGKEEDEENDENESESENEDKDKDEKMDLTYEHTIFDINTIVKY